MRKKFKENALSKLSGNWGKAIAIVICYVLVSCIIGVLEQYFSDYSIITLILSIVSFPLGFGFIISFWKLYSDEKVGPIDFIKDGFLNIGKAIGIGIYTLWKLLLPIILFVISIGLVIFESVMANQGVVIILGVVAVMLYFWVFCKSYFYQLSYIISAEDPSLSSKECVEKSEMLMAGRRWELFCLQLSFIGWGLLSVITLGIGFLWLIPYIQMTMICFYKNPDEKISDSSDSQK